MYWKQDNSAQLKLSLCIVWYGVVYLPWTIQTSDIYGIVREGFNNIIIIFMEFSTGRGGVGYPPSVKIIYFVEKNIAGEIKT